MGRRLLGTVLIALIAAAIAACGAGAPSPVPSLVPSPTPVLAATSFEEYAAGFCSAFDALFRAVGNPDTAEGSVLSRALDDAVAAHDDKSAEQLGAEITTELESGRRHVAFARGWAPAGPMMAHLDRVFVAFEAMTTAKVAAANLAPGSAEPTGGTPWQAAFEQAGGVEAWFAMLEAWPSIGAERPAGAKACANVPIGP